MYQCDFALITGTGFNDVFTSGKIKSLPELNCETLTTDTPYGSVGYEIISTGTITFFRINRHYYTGKYTFPHLIDARSYMYLLHQSGVQYIYATTAVGGVNRECFETIQVGSLVAPADFIDLTANPYTFGDDKNNVHPTAFYPPPTQLFCPSMRLLLKDKAILHGGILTNIIGPGYETPAERDVYCNLHPKVRLFGMTSTKEARLAREISVHYQPVGIVADVPSDEPDIEGEEVEKAIKPVRVKLIKVILSIFDLLQSSHHQWYCVCQKNPPVFDVL